MPSLIYITRIRPLSGELVQGLESAGFHVKFFGPGEITADACLLVMTSEAVLAGIQPGQGSAAGSTVANDAADVEAGAGNLGFSPPRSVRRPFAAAPPKAVAQQQSTPAVTARPKGRGNLASVCPTPPPPAPVIAELGSADALVPRSNSDQHLSQLEQHRKRLWQPAAMAVALLILAAALLTNRLALAPAATPATAAENANRDTQSDSRSAPSIEKGSTLPRLVPPRTPSVSADARQHISDYDFAAEDYTTHFDLHGHPGMEIPQLKHRAQNHTLPKRVVVN